MVHPAAGFVTLWEQQTLSFSLIVLVVGSSCMAIGAFVGARWEVLSRGLTLLAGYLDSLRARRSVAGELV